MAREAGFSNINVDLMFAIPGQSYEGWIENLRTVAALGPEHISAYSLIIEEAPLFPEKSWICLMKIRSTACMKMLLQF